MHQTFCQSMLKHNFFPRCRGGGDASTDPCDDGFAKISAQFFREIFPNKIKVIVFMPRSIPSNSLCYAHTAGLPQTCGLKSVSITFSSDGVTQQVRMISVLFLYRWSWFSKSVFAFACCCLLGHASAPWSMALILNLNSSWTCGLKSVSMYFSSDDVSQQVHNMIPGVLVKRINEFP